MKNKTTKLLFVILSLFTFWFAPKITFAANILQNTGAFNSIRGFGSGSGDYRHAIAWTPASNQSVYNISLQIYLFGTPTDGLVFKIYQGGGAPESGTLIGTSQAVPASTLTVPWSTAVFSFTSPVQLSAGTKYYFVDSRTGADDPHNNYTDAWSNTPNFSGANVESWDNAQYVGWALHSSEYLLITIDNNAPPPTQPPSMSITSPASGTYLSTAGSTAITGSCMNIGTGQLELTYSPFLARLDPGSAFNIDCSSAYTFSANFTPKDGENTVWIIDKSVQGENPPNIFNTQRYISTQYTGYDGSTSDLDWLLTIEYPPDNGSHIFTVNPNTQQEFRFRAHIPDDSLRPTTRIKYVEWTNSSRVVASSSIEFIGLDGIDLDGDGLLESKTDPVADGQTLYYTIYLENGTTTMYDIPYAVTGSATAQSAGTTVNPSAPDDRQYGPCLNLPLIGLDNFCLGTAFYALVIPNTEFYKDDVNDTYQLMQDKIPFAFYYQLKDQLSGVTATSTDFTYNIPVSLASSTGISLNIPFSSNNSGVHSIRSTLDPWFKAFCWFSFAWWAYRKAISFKF